MFPEHVFCGLAGDFARLYNSYLEVPKEFFFMGFLTAMGTLLSGRLTLALETQPQPRLYVLLLGESADDRKSTAIQKVTEFFYTAMVNELGNIRIQGLNTCWGLSSAEGLPKILKQSPNLMLCFDEFQQFVRKCGIKGSVLLPAINILFESNR